MGGGGREEEEVEKEGRKEEDGEEERRKRRDKRLIFGLLRLRGVTWSAGRGAPALAANPRTEKKIHPSIHQSFLFRCLSLPSLPLCLARGFSGESGRASRTASLSFPSPALPSLTHLIVPSPLPSFLSFPSLRYPLVSAPPLPLFSPFLEEEIGSCPCP